MHCRCSALSKTAQAWLQSCQRNPYNHQAGQERSPHRDGLSVQHSCACAAVLHGDTGTAAACSGLQIPDTSTAIIFEARPTPHVLSNGDVAAVTCGSMSCSQARTLTVSAPAPKASSAPLPSAAASAPVTCRHRKVV